MKKFIIGFIIGAMIFGSLAAVAVTYVAQPATFKVLVNGEEFVSDPPALVVEGRTYLPLRAMGDALGVPVEWNAELGQAEVGYAKSQFVAENDVATNDKWKMTFLGCKTYKQIDDYTKAADGKEFVVATFELENISTEKQTFSFLNLNSYFDDYKTPLNVLMGQQIDGATLMASAELEAGKKIKGYLAYEVSLNWSEFEIVYNDDILDKENTNAIRFTIKY